VYERRDMPVRTREVFLPKVVVGHDGGKAIHRISLRAIAANFESKKTSCSIVYSIIVTMKMTMRGVKRWDKTPKN
jgi:hypothetical protein